jgi:hypothetical protein
VAKYGVTALPREFNPNALGNVTPNYRWRIDPARLQLTGNQVIEQLAATRPIGIGSTGAGVGGMRGRHIQGWKGVKPESGWQEAEGPKPDPQVFGFAVWQLKEGEDQVIADRLEEIFREAKKS